jgi:hypothetical protein
VDIEALLAVVLVADVLAQDREPSCALASLRIADHHIDPRLAVGALVIGGRAGAVDDVLDIRCLRGGARRHDEQAGGGQ